MTDVLTPAIPPDPAPALAPANPPSPVPGIAKGTGPSWSAVVQNGLNQRQPQYRDPTPFQGKKFSCANVLMGGKINMDLKPARIIPNDPNAPGEYCLGYLVPLNTTYDELRYAASDLPTQYGSRADLTPHSGLGTISFNRKDDMEVACKAPLLIRGAEMPMCRLITYSPSLYRISMRGLKIPTGSMEEIEMFVRKIDATMSAYGVVQDIVIDILERGGRLFPHPRAEIIIRLNEDKAIPCTATIANTMVTLTGKCVEPFCIYCKTAGHLVDKCPTRPTNKKHGHTATAREELQPAALYAPPPRASKRAKKQPSSERSIPPTNEQTIGAASSNAQPRAPTSSIVSANPATAKSAPSASAFPATSPGPASSSSAKQSSLKHPQATPAAPSTNLPATSASPKQPFVTAIIPPANIPKSPAPPAPTKAAGKAPAQSSDWADMETDDVSDTGSNYSSPPPSPPRNSSGASNQAAQSPPDNPAIAMARAMLDEEGEKRISVEEMCVDSDGPARL
ncbi:hypothetical protein LPJ59_000459 [Coemansia sp. RSA 2399]|nr:hypothetical protein LPJ59_000459 [Coemansia sp. RSA 2399]